MAHVGVRSPRRGLETLPQINGLYPGVEHCCLSYGTIYLHYDISGVLIKHSRSEAVVDCVGRSVSRRAGYELEAAYVVLLWDEHK